MILRHTHGGQQLPSTGHSREQPPASAAPRANRKRCARDSRCARKHIARCPQYRWSPAIALASARIIRTRGISRDPGRPTDLPPECIGGAFARTSSAAGGAAVEVEPQCSSRTGRRRSATAQFRQRFLCFALPRRTWNNVSEIFISLFASAESPS